MSNVDDDDLDSILGIPGSDESASSDDGATPISIAGSSQNLLGVVPAPTYDAGRTAELPPCEGRTVELQQEGPCWGALSTCTSR